MNKIVQMAEKWKSFPIIKAACANPTDDVELVKRLIEEFGYASDIVCIGSFVEFVEAALASCNAKIIGYLMGDFAENNISDTYDYQINFISGALKSLIHPRKFSTEELTNRLKLLSGGLRYWLTLPHGHNYFGKVLSGAIENLIDLKFIDADVVRIYYKTLGWFGSPFYWLRHFSNFQMVDEFKTLVNAPNIADEMDDAGEVLELLKITGMDGNVEIVDLLVNRYLGRGGKVAGFWLVKFGSVEDITFAPRVFAHLVLKPEFADCDALAQTYQCLINPACRESDGLIYSFGLKILAGDGPLCVPLPEDMAVAVDRAYVTLMQLLNLNLHWIPAMVDLVKSYIV